MISKPFGDFCNRLLRPGACPHRVAYRTEPHIAFQASPPAARTRPSAVVNGHMPQLCGMSATKLQNVAIANDPSADAVVQADVEKVGFFVRI